MAETERKGTGVKSQPKREAKAKQDNKRTPIGVWLSENEEAEVEGIMAEEGLKSRSKLLRFAIAYFLKQYKADKVKLPTKTETTIDF